MITKKELDEDREEELLSEVGARLLIKQHEISMSEQSSRRKDEYYE